MGQIMATLRPSSSTNSENTRKRKRDNSSCSEEDELITTPSLPSSSTPRWKHDVFLSFCGKDTRRSFTDHLYFDLKWKGILVFRDDESLEKGKCISPELLQAIQESRYAIVIFSANYASSKWCLTELAEIVEWEEKKNLTIIPIFYHVDPSDVRNQRGTFAEAFAAHEKDPKVDIKEIDTWRNACRKAGNISGEHINEDRYETTIIQETSRIIFYNYTMLNIRIHYDGQKLVGINSRVEEMINLLDMESNDVRFLGIHGMGGVGKTTLAEIIYYRFSCRFEGSSFISCIRERSTTAPDLASLQKQLLSKIMRQEIHIWDYHDGIMLMSNRLRNKKVLIVLDDVDSDEQLTAFAGDQEWFGPGSRVIITCRDSHLLKRNKVNGIFEVQPLQTTDALQLLSLSAFDKTNPPENYKDLSMNFVHYAGGLPLALKVLGRFLVGREIDAWKSASDQLEANPEKEIFDILKISFDGLKESQQKLFLDMACYCPPLTWWQSPPREDYFKKIYPAIDFEVLVDKSLLIKFYDELKMHDLLEKMGQEIVHRQCPDEPGRRSRLFRAEDVVHVLKNDTGTDAIESIVLFRHPDEAKHRFGNIKVKAFSKMRKLRFLHIGQFVSCIIKWRGNPLKYMPSDKLQILHWCDCPSESWPRSFQPKNLVELNMPGSCFKRLWKGLMVLPNLKYLLKLYNSKNLIEMPDLSGAPNLEIIDFSFCTRLRKIHPSIGFLKRLKHLSLNQCSSLGNFLNILGDMTSLERLSLPPSQVSIFPSAIYSLSSLERLCLSDWSRLEKFPDLSMLECLKEFKAYGTTITQIPSINLIPKSICSFELEGERTKTIESRDLVMFYNDCSLPKQSSYPTNHDIGSPVEYEIEETLSVKIHFDDWMPHVLIQGRSLGSRIPEWVHNKSNVSSLFFDMCKVSSQKIELDDNTTSAMGIAIFIVCQVYSIPSVNFRGHNWVKFQFWLHDNTPEKYFCHYDIALYECDSFDKPFVLWMYLFDPMSLNGRLKSLDRRKISITTDLEGFDGQTPSMEVKVKEWGLHLVCPDDAALGLGSDIDSFINFINLGLETYADKEWRLDSSGVPL